MAITPVEDITFSYADSKKPFAPIQGGSFTTATVGSAVQNACQALNEKLFKLARKMKNSVLTDTKFKNVQFQNGWISFKNNSEIKVSVKNILAINEGKAVKQPIQRCPIR